MLLWITENKHSKYKINEYPASTFKFVPLTGRGLVGFPPRSVNMVRTRKRHKVAAVAPIVISSSSEDEDDVKAGPSPKVPKRRIEDLHENAVKRWNERQKSGTRITDEEIDSCPICLDKPPVHPVKLECGHSFCFLCAKGLVQSYNNSCSLCRHPIAPGFFDQSSLLERSASDLTVEEAGQWFYEGRKGWWKFEKRNNDELEELFQSGQKMGEMLICGNLYVIDLYLMIQSQKDNPIKKRRIKRDGDNNTACVGVAGLVKKT